MAARVWVVGSLNADLVISASRLPAWGETLAGGALATLAGGKGANQACAAARMGARTTMIGSAGADDHGSFLISELGNAGVDTGGVQRTAGAGTGCAMIFVRQSDGANAIVLSPGANLRLTPAAVEERLAPMSAGDVLLCQLETPAPAVLAALRMARLRDAVSILDPAPAQGATAELLAAADIVTPNESEAMTILGAAGEELGDPLEAARRLCAAGVKTALLKLGAQGALWLSTAGIARPQQLRIPAFPVPNVVDTTAAGDTFNGAFAAGLVAGRSDEDSLRSAAAAAALSVTRRGAQASIPTAAEVRAFLASQPDIP